MLNDGEQGVIVQRDRTYAIRPHIPCGVVTPEILRKLADAAEKYQCRTMKITSAARVLMIGLQEEDIPKIWADLGMTPGGGVGVRSVKTCPGTSACKRAVQDSLAVGLALDAKYHGQAMPGKTKMGVSGCPNQCAETAIKDIGLFGTPRGWRVVVGGNGGTSPRLSQGISRDLSTEEALALIDRVVAYYRANGKPRERLGRVIARLGIEHLREGVGLTSDGADDEAERVPAA